MDAWLIRQAQRRSYLETQPDVDDGRANEIADRPEDTLILGSPDRINLQARLKAIRVSPRSTNPGAATRTTLLFSIHQFPKGSYVTDRARVAHLLPSAIADVDGAQGSADGQTRPELADESGTNDDNNDKDDEEPTIDYAALYAECEVIFSKDPKLLIGERLLKVASLYTNVEVVETVKLHHPQASLPPKFTTGITRALSDSVTRAASQRGVPREVVGRELDLSRDVNGVLERQVAHNARQKEAKKKTAEEEKMRAERGFGSEAEPMEVDGEDDDIVFLGSGVGAVMNGVSSSKAAANGKATPYVLGNGQPVQERIIANSDEEEEL